MQLRPKLLLLCDRRGMRVDDTLAAIRLVLDELDDDEESLAHEVGRVWREIKEAR
jgi:hypothetical protein